MRTLPVVPALVNSMPADRRPAPTAQSELTAPEGLPLPVTTHDTTDGKALAKLQARAALAGWVLSAQHEGQSGPRFTVARWGMVRELGDLGEVARFLAQVGAPR